MKMSNYYICAVVLRIILPICFVAAIFIRPVGISILYMIMYLYQPFVPVPTPETFKGHSGHYLRTVLVISWLCTVVQVAFQIAVSTVSPAGWWLGSSCSMTETILRHFGFVSLFNLYGMEVAKWIVPELLMVLASTASFILCKKMCSGLPAEEIKASSPKRKYGILVNLGKYLALLGLMFVGVVEPCILSAPYFVFFLAGATWWASGRELGRTFAIICRIFMVYMVFHITAIFIYLTRPIQELLPPDEQIPRILGLINLITMDCMKDPRVMDYGGKDWTSYIQPLAILCGYYILAVESAALLDTKAGHMGLLSGGSRGNDAPVETTPLIRQLSPQQAGGRRTLEANAMLDASSSAISTSVDPRRSIVSASVVYPDSTTSVTIGIEGDQEDEATKEDIQDTIIENIIIIVMNLSQTVMRSSYIATIITMMAWSIMYHSWLTFVFLLWANTTWMVKDQRRFTLRCSPYLVLYAELLLIVQFVYSLNLTEDELPTSIQGVNLNQLGLDRPLSHDISPMIVKIIFTIVFFATLRLRASENEQKKRNIRLQGLATPLQLGVGTAGSVLEDEPDLPTSQFLQKAGNIIKWFLTRFWICIVAIMLFVIGITGERMTMFRILYMALFLLFIVMFQISWRMWRRMMYGFWVTVIVYSMVILILIYTYQFDNFPQYLEQYIKIPMTLQLDIGLEEYKTKDLFLRLLTPSLFLIITMVQLQYFHKDFLEFTNLESSRADSSSNKESQYVNSVLSSSYGVETAPPTSAGEKLSWSELEPANAPADTEPFANAPGPSSVRSQSPKRKRSLRRMPTNTSQHASLLTEDPSTLTRYLFAHLYKCSKNALDLIILFLEVHFVKIIYFSVMLLCVFDVCAMHLLPMLLVTISLFFSSRIQNIVLHILSIILSIFLISKMIYQIEYIQHEKFDVNCTDSVNNITNSSNAEWFGFKKMNAAHTLPQMTKGYIGVIIIMTVYSMICFRQRRKRLLNNLPLLKPRLMFPEISRKDADNDTRTCLKFLFNFGFYKFGIEICLTCIIILIGSRMDVIAVIYSLWLCYLMSINRERTANSWTVLMIFLIVLIALQYIISIGFLPEICFEYPWNHGSEATSRAADWLYLPYTNHMPDPKKIIFDFLLLIACSRQAIVFRIERKYGDSYKGGSNTDNISEDWESPDFVNPVPDFVTYVRSWLDIVKRISFLGMLWIALAIMFLAGTNRVNLFSLGYLIGSFIFLWQGTDFYLRPRKDILRWWGYLLNYNVFVITVKAFLQIAGCIFLLDLQDNACWFVQLLGIGCVDKFSGGTIKTFFKMSKIGLDNEHECSVPKEDIGLAWDGVCFVMLLLQRRLLQSYYFLRIIDESKASSILASRGAELIEKMRQKQVKHQEEQEQKILEKIKVKMERIKANQNRIHGEGTKEPLYHHTAVRSGDYYMFDDFDDEVQHLDLVDDMSTSSEESLKNMQMTVGELLSEAMRTDLRNATEKAALRRKQTRDRTSVSESIPRPQSAGDPEKPNEDDMELVFEQSKAPDGSEIPSDVPADTIWKKIFRFIAFCLAFVESLFISLSRRIRKLSRDYRYIAKVLSKEKIQLKENRRFGLGIRSGTHIWQPSLEILAQMKRENSDDNNLNAETTSAVSLQVSEHASPSRKVSELSVPEIRILAASLERGLEERSPQALRRSPIRREGLQAERPEAGFVRQSSVYSIPTESTETETNFADYDDENFAANKSALVQFLFAVWYAILAHTDIVCYLMIFLNQIQSATMLSIPLPLMVFLWGTLCIPRPTKTFWVTIIAYTEAIVLLKSMFQYEILPWNQKVIPDNMPFSAPRIIGIERKSNYAAYDLVLLLLVFFHRFMLKSLGLWTEDNVDEEAYPVKTDDEMRTPIMNNMIADKSHGEIMPKAVSSDEDTPPGSLLRKRKVTYQSYQGETEHGEPDGSIMLNEMVEDKEEEVYSFHGDNYKDVPNILKSKVSRYFRSFKSFIMKMVEPTSRVTADVYAYMFMCDFFNFLVVIFGFSAFGTHQGDGGVQAYLEENKVPIPFLIMLILQFVLIVIDRALYLRKYILGKIFFQLILIVGIHTWMFFVLPGVTDRSFNSLIPPPLWYMVKCIYLLLSAYQIRCGFPTRILGNFLCKGYTSVNMVLFKGFKAVPFLFELRALMDWIWTDTSMTLMDWLKMEDIFSIVYQLKCSRAFDDAHPMPRGQKKSTFSKYLMGGLVLTFIIALIWFPLVLFAFGNSVGVANPPYDVTVKIRVGPYLPVYTMSAQSRNILTFSSQEFDTFTNIYIKDRTAQTFLSNYMFNDLAAVQLNSNSTNIWAVSPPDLARLQQEAQSNASLHVKFTYVISHKTNSKDNPPIIEEEVEIDLGPFVAGSTTVRNPERDKLVRMLDGTAGKDEWVLIHHIFPKFVKVLNKGTALPVTKLMNPTFSESDGSYRNITLRLLEMEGQKWWQVRESCTDLNYESFLKNIPHMNCDQLVMYTFNDKLFPETLNIISGSGIIGLYTTFVFLASRVIRGFFSGQCFTIMFEDLPNVDRILQLCLDIYLVREVGELSLEEDLFAKLVFLYRSPETMIKWSRAKDEPEEEMLPGTPPPQH